MQLNAPKNLMAGYGKGSADPENELYVFVKR